MSTGPLGSSEPPGSGGGSKAPLVLGGVLLLALLSIGGAVLLLMSGGDGDEAAAETTAPAEEDAADEFDDFSDDFSDDLGDGEDDAAEPDTDLDGVPDSEDPDDDDDGVADAEDPGDEGPPADLDLLRVDPSPAIDAFKEAAGRVTPTVEVALYPTYAFLQVKVADRPQATLDWAWRDGALDGPESTEPFPGTDLDTETFPLGAPNWDALPRLVADAPQRAGLPQGEVSHVIVTSDAPFSSRFLFRIYVTAPNGSDYVIATIDGQPAQR